MIRLAFVCSCFAAGALLAGCGTSPPAKYYTLSPADIAYTPDPDQSIVLGIGPIRVPEYLERPQIVTRAGNARLNVDDFNRWVEPIADVQYRIIATNVDALLDDVIVIAFPYGRLADYDYRLIARIGRFDMDYRGKTVLDVHWTITDAEDNSVVPPRRSSFTASGGDPENPSVVALAMDDCLEQFSRAIATEFRAGLAASGAE